MLVSRAGLWCPVVVILCILSSTSARFAGNAGVSQLERDLQSNDPTVRAKAARQLGEKGTSAKKAVPALADALKDADADVRRNAAHALGEIDPENPRVIDSLIEALKDKDLGVSVSLSRALKKGGKAAIVALGQALHHKHSVIRAHAALELHGIGPNAVEAFPFLLDALSDKEEKGRINASAALQVIGPSVDNKDKDRLLKALVKALRDVTSVRMNATYALAKLGEAAVVDLMKCLQDPEENIRRSGAIALGEIGPKARIALPALRAAANDSSEDVRYHAREAIKSIEGEDR